MNTEIEMPLYQCHKKVYGLQIKDICINTDGSSTLIFEDGYSNLNVSYKYILKHNPVKGGYYVVYKDGYISFSPQKAFEDGYTKIK